MKYHLCNEHKIFTLLWRPWKNSTFAEAHTVSTDVSEQVLSYARAQFLYISIARQTTFLIYGRFADQKSKQSFTAAFILQDVSWLRN